MKTRRVTPNAIPSHRQESKEHSDKAETTFKSLGMVSMTFSPEGL